MPKASFARVDRALAMPPLRTELSLVAVCCQAFELTLAQSRIFAALPNTITLPKQSCTPPYLPTATQRQTSKS